MLAINDEQFNHRAEIIWEKGTNRSSFFRGEVDKYGWVDVGSSFLPSEITAAFLWAQLEQLDNIQSKRKLIWDRYCNGLSEWAVKNGVGLPVIHDYATNNGHMFYVVCPSLEQRNELLGKLKKNDIHAVFHYQSLHKSQFYKDKHDGRDLPNSDRFTDCLLRLPMYYDLSESDVDRIVEVITK